LLILLLGFDRRLLIVTVIDVLSGTLVRRKKRHQQNEEAQPIPRYRLTQELNSRG